MHRELRELLEDATGESQFVIAVNLDIRGFSSFSKEVESPDVAMFIKRVYMTLVDTYFEDASFFKPTGDGLLIIMPYSEGDLQTAARKTIDVCHNAVTKFHSFCADDPMINFRTPNKIGIGISRGTACRLVSGEKTLDYSGRVLNMASKLMDVARPSGIVFDAAFGKGLLSKSQAKLFAEDSIYVRGIAESKPIDICYTKDFTQISAQNKQPLDETKWDEIEIKRTLREMKAGSRYFMQPLPTKLLDPSELRVIVHYPAARKGKKIGGLVGQHYFKDFEYLLQAGKPYANIDFHTLTEQLEKLDVKGSWLVEIRVVYPIR